MLYNIFPPQEYKNSQESVSHSYPTCLSTRHLARHRGLGSTLSLLSIVLSEQCNQTYTTTTHLLTLRNLSESVGKVRIETWKCSMTWSPKNIKCCPKCFTTFIKVEGLRVCTTDLAWTKCLQPSVYNDLNMADLFHEEITRRGFCNSRGILFFFNQHLRILLAQWNRNKPNGQWIITSMCLQLYNIKVFFFFFNVMIQGKIISHFVSCVFDCFMSINVFVSN